MGLARATAAAVIMSTVALTAPAFAQPKPQQPAPSQPQGQPSDGTTSQSNMEEARQRYKRGLQLFNEANYEAARVEFERAYALAPSYKIFYNIGLSYEQLGDYVQAQSTLQRYLDLGGSEIGEDRRSEVAKELAQIRPRIGRVTVKTNVAGTDLFVDDVCATEANSGKIVCGSLEGTSREVLMNPGRRRVTLRKTGYLPETATITVAGSDRTEITIEVKPLPKGYVEKETNPFWLPVWIGVGVTVAGAATAGIAGGLALKANSDQKQALDSFQEQRSDLDSGRTKTRTLATVSDVAMVTTVVAAGATGYFLYRALRWHGEAGREANVNVGLGGVSLSGRF